MKVFNVGDMVFSQSKGVVYQIEAVILDEQMYAASRKNSDSTFCCVGLSFDDCTEFASEAVWYAESTFLERSSVIVKALVELGWLSSKDGLSAISPKGYVVRLEAERARYLEVYCNGLEFWNMDMRGFHPYSVLVLMHKLQSEIKTKERELRL